MSQISHLYIDSHQHFWNYDPAKYSWIDDRMFKIRNDFLPSDLESVLKKNNVNGTVAVEAYHSEQETEFLLRLAGEFSFIKGVVGWVDLAGENIRQRLVHFSKNSFFKGVRHTVYDQKGEFLTDPNFQAGISELKRFGLTYDLLVLEGQLPGAIELVRKFPDQKFVLDHMGKPAITSKGPSEEWIAHIKELTKSENVFCKISGMVTETPGFQWETSFFSPFLEVVTKEFGTDRIMFGSDWPVCLSAATYRDVKYIIDGYFSKYDKEVREDVFGRNAVKFYNL